MVNIQVKFQGKTGTAQADHNDRDNLPGRDTTSVHFPLEPKQTAELYNRICIKSKFVALTLHAF